MSGELGTTNLLLGIMAAVSLIEGFVIVGMGVAGFLVCRRLIGVISAIEARQVAPAMARVNAILDDVRAVTATVKDETERVDRAIHTTVDLIDVTAGRVGSSVLRGLRMFIEAVRRSRHHTHETQT
jgi:hypothetical protein